MQNTGIYQLKYPLSEKNKKSNCNRNRRSMEVLFITTGGTIDKAPGMVWPEKLGHRLND